MTDQTARTEHPSKHRRRRAIRAGSVLTLAALLAASTAASGGDSAEQVAAQITEAGPVTFAMAVKPGQPVPMEMVTEKSSSEYAGAGATGKGIDVAIVDSGVTMVPGLDQPGKIIYGPDLSNEGAQRNLANVDSYGHGTHLAGIINGDDGDMVVGVAPDSRLVSVKVAGATGETSLAQVIAGIDWVVVPN